MPVDENERRRHELLYGNSFVMRDVHGNETLLDPAQVVVARLPVPLYIMSDVHLGEMRLFKHQRDSLDRLKEAINQRTITISPYTGGDIALGTPTGRERKQVESQERRRNILKKGRY